MQQWRDPCHRYCYFAEVAVKSYTLLSRQGDLYDGVTSSIAKFEQTRNAEDEVTLYRPKNPFHLEFLPTILPPDHSHFILSKMSYIILELNDNTMRCWDLLKIIKTYADPVQLINSQDMDSYPFEIIY
jgi:hypothetical protein